MHPNPALRGTRLRVAARRCGVGVMGKRAAVGTSRRQAPFRRVRRESGPRVRSDMRSRDATLPGVDERDGGIEMRAGNRPKARMSAMSAPPVAMAFASSRSALPTNAATAGRTALTRRPRHTTRWRARQVHRAPRAYESVDPRTSRRMPMDRENSRGVTLRSSSPFFARAALFGQTAILRRPPLRARRSRLFRSHWHRGR